jgi:copper chaperone CopZ
MEKEVSSEALRSAKVSVLAVTGMGCPNCALRVHNSLLLVPGVHQVEVDLERSQAVVRWDPAVIQPDTLIEAVSRAAVGTHHDYRAYFVEE